jgi:hypothetical protein
MEQQEGERGIKCKDWNEEQWPTYKEGGQSKNVSQLVSSGKDKGCVCVCVCVRACVWWGQELMRVEGFASAVANWESGKVG